MIPPPWMIDEVEKARREREERRRPELRIEIPVPQPGWTPKKPAWQEEPSPVPRGVAVII